jgi:copper ion binding protein
MATVANPTAVAEICPACSTKGKKVAPLTVRALVKPELTSRVRDETYRFCESPTCDVVYFSEQHPEQRFYRADIRVRVGQKETTPPIQVCYCFDWTTDDIQRELRLTGGTTIPERIKRMVQQGYCQCETMNPQGSCCLGNVNKAVKEVRAILASLPGAGADTAPAAPAQRGRTKGRGAFLATLGAVFTAIMGTACCWLPLLLIAFGFSAAGVGSFFEQYRPYFLTVTFALLAVAWYFTYRAAIWRAWARLQGKPAPASAVEACCATEATSAPAHSCCATEPEPKPAAVHSCCGIEAEPEPEDCCAPPAKTVAGQPVRGRFTMRQFNQVMLWMATVMIVLFALFPHWIGLLLGGAGRNPTAAVNPDDQQQIVLELKGMTCEGCAPIVEKALRGVPGVSAATVSYEKSQAVVFVPKGQEVPRDAILQAVRQAGYEARFVEGPALSGNVYRLELSGMSCEGCAATIQQALRKVPGVGRVDVNYSKAVAVVTAQPGRTVEPEALFQAVHDAGYGAQVKK